MPGLMLHTGMVASCPHGGQVQAPPAQPRVLVGGMPASTMAGLFPIVGCPFTVPAGPATVPQPCLRVQWTVPSARVLVAGSPALTLTSAGLTLGPTQAPQGSAIIATTQARVVVL